MINWVLQKNITKPALLHRIKSLLTEPDLQWEEIEVIPFSDEVLEIKNKGAFNICYGSTTFMLNAYLQDDLSPGVLYDPEKFQMKNYVEQWNSDVPDLMLTFANARIKEYRLHDVYVMDIAQVNNTFKVIECNCFNGTGFYAHDVEAIVEAVNEFIRKKL